MSTKTVEKVDTPGVTHLMPTPLPAGKVKRYIRDLTEDLWDRDHPTIMLWGAPGVGKSSITEQTAVERGWGFIDIRLTLVQIIDVIGLPYIEQVVRDGEVPERLTMFARSIFLPTKDHDRWIIMLDELPSAVPSIQVQAYQLMSEHRIGPHRLDPGVHVIAAGNRLTDKGVVYRMPSPLINRCLHLEISPELEDWLDYMYPRGLEPEVAAYLRRYPQRLLELHPNIDTLPFPSPRSWTYTSRTIKKARAVTGGRDQSMFFEYLRPLLEGLIGPGVATDFITYLRVFDELPDTEAIMEGRASPTPPSSPDALFALVSSLVGLTTRYEDLRYFLTYITKLPRTFTVLALKDAFRMGQGVIRRITSCPNWSEIAKEYKDEIIAVSGAI